MTSQIHAQILILNINLRTFEVTQTKCDVTNLEPTLRRAVGSASVISLFGSVTCNVTVCGGVLLIKLIYFPVFYATNEVFSFILISSD